jgi:hypothetical protein
MTSGVSLNTAPHYPVLRACAGGVVGRRFFVGGVGARWAHLVLAVEEEHHGDDGHGYGR